MSHTVVLTMLICYVYACFGMELICKGRGSYPPDIQVLIEDEFCDIPKFMLNLMQIAFHDDAGAIYEPVILAAPGAGALFFLSYILLLSLALIAKRLDFRDW